MTTDNDGEDDDSDLAQRTTVMRGYDELADAYADERDDAGPSDHLDQLLEDAPPGPVLDAGCGDGRTGLAPLHDDRLVLGLDVSVEQVRRAADVAPGRVLQGDMTALPVADDAVAAIAALYSVIHVPADQHADVYAEFQRVLEPGGVALVTTGTENWAGRNDDWLDTGTAMEWDILGRTESEARLHAAGFDVYDYVGVVDALGEKQDSRLVDPDHPDADKLLLFARLED